MEFVKTFRSSDCDIVISIILEFRLYGDDCGVKSSNLRKVIKMTNKVVNNDKTSFVDIT